MEPLRDDAIVVRFGRDSLRVEHLRGQASLCHEAQGFYGISFYGDNDLSLDEVSRLAAKPNRELRTSTVGRLRKAGFHLERRGRFPHLTLRFGANPSDENLRAVEAVFDPPERNPHPPD